MTDGWWCSVVLYQYLRGEETLSSSNFTEEAEDKQSEGFFVSLMDETLRIVDKLGPFVTEVKNGVKRKIIYNIYLTTWQPLKQLITFII